MSHRVIAGSARGRKLKTVPGDGTRPVMDRVKEALFSILGTTVYEARVLDLFAGTGAVGIEALSRGATQAVFFDLSHAAIKTITENLQTTGLADRAIVRRVDALATLKQIPSGHFDLIYIAPPQYKGLWLEALQALDGNPGWLHDDGVVVVQIDPKEQQPIQLKHLEPYDTRRYGNTLLWFFEPVIDDDAANVSTQDEGSS